jgi:hypothetical protein
MSRTTARPKIILIDIRHIGVKGRDFVVKEMYNTIKFSILDRISEAQVRDMMRHCDIVVLQDK